MPSDKIVCITREANLVSNNLNGIVVDARCPKTGITTWVQPCDVALNDFMGLVGKRVKHLRMQRRWSGKKLTELAGVSLRYLSLLENGKGNASMGVLFKLARALECPVEQLIREDAAEKPKSTHLLQQFESAAPDVQLQVREILGASTRAPTKGNRVCLIGMRGAGKSSLGRSLADRVGVNFIELNSEIEQISGMSVNELFSLYGQEGYRKLEYKALEAAVYSNHSAVLAVAGDIVSSPDSYRYLLSHFNTVWLKATPEEHMQRLRAQGDDRPMLGNPVPMEDFGSTLARREAQYADADQMLNTSGKSVEQSQQDLYDATHRLFRD